MTNSDKTAIIDWLKDRHREIMECEADAFTALAANNVEGYGAAMRLKAEMLEELPELSQALVKNLPGDFRARVENGLEGFASGARTALDLDSVFYMSALLYPDTHKKGDPDNMEIFIESLKTM